MNYEALRKMWRLDEGRRNRRYLDTANPPRWTIGEGHNIDDDPHYPYTEADEPLSDAQIDALRERDIATAVSVLDEFVNWWRAMDGMRQAVLCDMCMNMGWAKLKDFKNTLNAMHFADYKTAADGMRNSLWAKQVGARAERLAKIMEEGA